jgi:hypothetical protein
MSDSLSSPLLAAAPLHFELTDTARVPLAALPCLRGLDLTARTAFREDP